MFQSETQSAEGSFFFVEIIIIRLDLQSAKLEKKSSFQKSEDLVGLTPHHGSPRIQTRTKTCMMDHGQGQGGSRA